MQSLYELLDKLDLEALRAQRRLTIPFATVPGSILAILTAVCYAGYLLILRKGRDRRRAAGPIFDSTLTCGLTALAAGLIVGDFEPLPSLPMHAWLLLLALSASFSTACDEGALVRWHHHLSFKIRSRTDPVYLSD